MSVLSVRNVSKSYRKYPNEFARIASWFGWQQKKIEEINVLKAISFDVFPGESIAIVGQNGAGKSTLLKMIVGTLKPTTGKVLLNGKVAAILELGMGFNPDFTGRQNAMHGLALMGYNHVQILSVLPELEAFAEIGIYFDQPLRVYSSGMQMRVAFAVATAFRPDILIVDEALSVGDTYFQHKSFARIRFFKEQGTTLLFVSHDKEAVLTLCDRAILLQQGGVLMDHTPQVVMDYYNALISQKEAHASLTQDIRTSGAQTRSGSQLAQITSVQLLNPQNQPVKDAIVGELLCLRVSLVAHAQLEGLVLGVLIKDRLGQSIFGTNTFYLGQVRDMKPGEELVYHIDFPANFGEGSYSITLALHQDENHLNSNLDWLDYACLFEVHNQNLPKFVGSSYLPVRIIEKSGGMDAR
ncbi:sugar ABC transporter ATP-binding protein [Thiosulfatimonas sediminis]|uniref:Sugar ABC transporter ATP-binding protein n=1 Tax=Thiosulfatimonas sediminis TaxID=2675054 RepID=A0A6F8PSJ0_9GAMM|nr:ABC transporter ATP-binding protein [Thiosulfatimonas sediminis]BBP45085.1 sugar ABC transporter ATP-binding protein [Thiosulfatimonas sediminis]